MARSADGEANKNIYKPIIHHSGSGYAKWDSWEAFMDGKNYKGIYRPKQTPNSAAYDAFVVMGRKIANNNISYSFVVQMQYGSSSNWVYVEDITGIRCDGVIEYCYEWNNYRVFGWNAWWDISAPGNASKFAWNFYRSFQCSDNPAEAKQPEGVSPAVLLLFAANPEGEMRLTITQSMI